MYSGEEVDVIVCELVRCGGNAARVARILRDAGGRFAGISNNTVARVRSQYAKCIKQCREQMIQRAILRCLEEMENHRP